MSKQNIDFPAILVRHNLSPKWCAGSDKSLLLTRVVLTGLVSIETGSQIETWEGKKTVLRKNCAFMFTVILMLSLC